MIAIQMTATVTRRHSLLLFLDYEVCFLPLITLIYLGNDEVMRNIAIKIKKKMNIEQDQMLKYPPQTFQPNGSSIEPLIPMAY